MAHIPLLSGAVGGEMDGALRSRLRERCMVQPHRSTIRRSASWRAVQFVAAIAVLFPWPVQAQNSDSGTNPPTRPSIMFNRWEEDWSVLADPRVPREPFDSLKYIPLSVYDPKTYLSFGANLRERFEGQDAANFGIGTNRNQNYVISRSEAHADLRIADQLQVFVQLQSDFAPWKHVLTPVDQDNLDLEQAFVMLTEPLGGGTVKVRVGRQQIAFDLQRFVSVRDGPNVRQSYDGAWMQYEIGPWLLHALYTEPVQTRNNRPFDDFSSGALTYSGFKIERTLFDSTKLSVYVSQFRQEEVRYGSVMGNEHRDILDGHFSGKANGFDWDVEAMGQNGGFADKTIRAWAVGSLAGYTFNAIYWKPRLGLQFDAASGNRDPNSNVLQTFNPLFPNGAYFTLAGYTTYVNLIHFKQSLTLQPTNSVKILLAVAEQWRETTADAVYAVPNIPLAGTAGQPGRYTGTYGQGRVDWTITRQLSFALEAVYFRVSDVIERAGGHNSRYVGVELAYAW